MNKLKSIFFHLSIVYWVLVSAFTLYMLYAIGINLPTIGMTLVSILPTWFIIWLNITSKPRTSENQTLITFSVLIGFAILIIGSVNFSFFLISIYGINLVFWILYIFWFSYLPKRTSSILQLGNVLPELEFKAYNNEPFYGSSLLGKKAIYLFYRGNWCPVCMAQIKEITGQYQDLKNNGAEMVLISPQPQHKTKELAQKIGVEFLFLTDEHNQMAKKLEIDHLDGVPIGNKLLGEESDTVLPTVIITNEGGKIIFLDQTDNFRIRPEPSTFISVLKNQRA